MKKAMNSFLQGLVVAAIVGFWFERRRRITQLAGIGGGRDTEHLLDLNTASEEELAALPGLDRELVARIIENRPYRNKRELIARVVIAEETYELIKHFVHVPRETATKPVKAAG